MISKKALASKIKLYFQLSRPFTLIAPALGFFTSGITAIGALKVQLKFANLKFILLGSLMAATLNAASNVLNQIYDLPLDKINKPNRPLCTGAISVNSAKLFALSLYLLSLLLAWFINPTGSRECFYISAIAGFLTYIYSAPPIRTKRFCFLSNLTIAIPRGVLLKVAGWSAVGTILDIQPWYIGLIFGLFLLGAASTKDFADIEGDRKYGCYTLPVKYGIRKSAIIISPFFVFPWLLIPFGSKIGNLTGNYSALLILSIILILWGIYVTYLILRKPEELATDENHISWTHMYLMTFTAHIGFAVAYTI